MKMRFLFVLLLPLFFAASAWADIAPLETRMAQAADTLLGEKLSYDISFLWFEKIAQGEISFVAGELPGTYLATLKAKTKGMAAFFTSNRVETYTTLMEEGPGGFLRPLLQTSDTKKDKGGKETHRQTHYQYDFSSKQVTYKKLIDGDERQKILLDMDNPEATYDFLSAFYNLRLGRLGALELGREIRLKAFSRKGSEEIVISRLDKKRQQKMDFDDGLLLCKVLMTPETFKTKTRDLYVGFDRSFRPELAVVKNVIGLGDVRGTLTHAVAPQALPEDL